jgi:molybdopterin-guanine dinucleotide biosynthesis protein A
MNSDQPPPLGAVILAGGRSSRMGRDKAWIEWAGQPLIAHALEKVRRLGVAEVFISGRPDVDYGALGCPVLLDREPGRGPLGGIERALHECASPLLLVLAVDLPHMTAGLLARLAARCDARTGAVPKLGDKLEPLAAIYPRRCHALARAALAQARAAARDFATACLREQAVRVFPVAAADAGCFANWNRPDDLGEP